MIERIREVLAPPVFAGDDDKTRASRLLNLLVLSSLLGVVVYLPFAAPDRAPIAILAAGVLVAVWFMLIRGHVGFASVALVAGLALVIGTGTWTGGGVRSPAFGGLTMLILFAGILLGWKASMGMAVLSILYGIILLRYDFLGFLPAPTAYSPAGYWVIESIFFILAGLILTISLRLTNDALGRARNEIMERRAAESSLRNSEAFVENVLNSLTAHIAVLNDRGVIIAVNEAWRAFARENGGEDEAKVSVGANYFVVCEEAIDRDSDGLARAALDGIRSVMDGRQASFSLEYPCHSPAEQRWFSMQVLPLENTESRVVIAHENVTEFKLAEDRLEKRHRELATVYQASRRLQNLLPLDLLAQEIIDVMEETMEYTYGAVLLVDQNTGKLEPFALSSQKRGAAFLEADREYVRSRGVGIGVGITGWVAQHGQSLRLDDVRKDPRYLSLREDIRSELCVPLRVGDRVIGVVNIETTETAAYSENDQRVLETIAAQIAIAIQNARLLVDLQHSHSHLAELSRRFAQVNESERRAISRELHDRVGQNLTALSISIQNLKGLLPPEAIRIVEAKFDDAQELVQDTTRIIREVMSELHPPELEDHGLVAALETYAEKTVSRAGMELNAHLPELLASLPLETSTALFRAAQEAVTNVLKHADAKRIDIDLEEEDHRLRLRIADDGRGFDVGALKRREIQSWGLRIMQERLESVGGNVQVESDPGRGTIVTFEVAVEA